MVTGTGTEVGKTWVCAGLASSLLAEGFRVAVRKPAQSFAPGEGPTDAEVLAAATGERPEVICPARRWYERAMAPPMAADALGRPRFTIRELAGEVRFDTGIDVGVVEGAGGLASPLASDGDTRALAHLLGPDLVLVVADTALGVISHTRLVAEALRGFNVVIFLNRYDDTDVVHRRSRDWLAEIDGLDVCTDLDALTIRLTSKIRGGIRA
jgi:dethiobiotin synthetase